MNMVTKPRLELTTGPDFGNERERAVTGDVLDRQHPRSIPGRRSVAERLPPGPSKANDLTAGDVMGRQPAGDPCWIAVAAGPLEILLEVALDRGPTGGRVVVHAGRIE